MTGTLAEPAMSIESYRALLDATFDNATNKVVEGSTTQRTEATELWTFVRKGPGGKWMLSAIQQTQTA